MQGFGKYVLPLKTFFFPLNFQIDSIFSRFYYTSRVGKERRKPSSLQFVKKDMESGRCDGLGNCIFQGVNHKCCASSADTVPSSWG